MSGVVVDASIVIAWLFDNEEEPRSDEVLELLVEDGALVPHLWHLETRNTLLVAERSGRLSAEGVSERLDALMDLPIQTDQESNIQSAFHLARVHELSFYDAIYLELAKRKGATLATLDRALSRAATAEGVRLPIT